ncbi:MAG: light-harvesting protein [Kouleothrix sp.]|nr:light-harvesting protein [Kouleothrix sp.]
MAQGTLVREEFANDLVPAPYKSILSNDDWTIHRIVVQTTYAMVVLVLIAHALCWFWKPWLQ